MATCQGRTHYTDIDEPNAKTLKEIRQQQQDVATMHTMRHMSNETKERQTLPHGGRTHR